MSLNLICFGVKSMASHYKQIMLWRILLLGGKVSSISTWTRSGCWLSCCCDWCGGMVELQVKQVCCSSRRRSWIQGVVDVIIVNTTNKNFNYFQDIQTRTKINNNVPTPMRKKLKTTTGPEGLEPN